VAVAVVVEAVADLGDRAAPAGADEAAAGAGERALPALADVGAARAAATDVLVGARVAVVVEPVAGRGHRAPAARADERSADAARRAGDALADVAPVRDAATRIALVDVAVAVVVAPVARLGARPSPADAGEVTVDAGHGARRALADVAPARAGARYALVDDVVAVLVGAVAGLGARAHAADAGQRARHARKHAGRARADVGPTRCPAAGVSFVDVAVAVVVDPVAALGARPDLADAGAEDAADADLIARLAGADVAPARLLVSVHDAVAIV